MPSVVSITSTIQSSNYYGFGTQESEGAGSGFIIAKTKDSLMIATNNHVVSDATTLTVGFVDDTTAKATVVGTDSSADLAVISVKIKDIKDSTASKIKVATLGSSDDLKVGEEVVAIGNALGYGQSVTTGVVSAKNREVSLTDGTMNLLQTDAAINPGNSGGALVDAQGRLIGINTMIFSETGNYSGYSFAVPINTAAKIVSDLKKYGSVQRAVLGIIGGTVNEDVKKEKNLKVSQGVYVNEFSEVSAAYAAGIEEGDVIVGIDGNKITDMGELQERIGRCRPGDTIVVTVDRKGTKRDFKVTLKNDEGSTEIVKRDSSSLLGATLREISGDQLRKQGVSYGLEVVKVGKGKLQEAGIKEGFIILSINNKAVRSVSAARKLVDAAQKTRRGDKAILVKGFYPGGSMKYYAIDLS